MRIVTLVGRDSVSGDLIPVGVAESAGVEDLMALRKAIKDANGRFAYGKREIKLSELVCLANHTSGGELKTRLKF